MRQLLLKRHFRFAWKDPVRHALPVALAVLFVPLCYGCKDGDDAYVIRTFGDTVKGDYSLFSCRSDYVNLPFYHVVLSGCDTCSSNIRVHRQVRTVKIVGCTLIDVARLAHSFPNSQQITIGEKGRLCHLKDIDRVDWPTQLELLDLSNVEITEFDGLFESLRQTRLRFLSLTINSTEDLDSITRCRDLEELTVRARYSLKRGDALLDLPKLEAIYLGENADLDSNQIRNLVQAGIRIGQIMRYR